MGKQKKQKKPLPPKLPPKAAYFVYRDQVYRQIRKKHSTLNKGDLTELISNEWDKLPKQEKLNYQSRFEQSKKDYEKQKQEYQSSYGTIDPEQQQKREQLEAKKLQDIKEKGESNSKSKKDSKSKSKAKSKDKVKDKDDDKGKNKSKSKKAKNKKGKHSSDTEQDEQEQQDSESGDEQQEKAKAKKKKEKVKESLMNKSRNIQKKKPQKGKKNKGGKATNSKMKEEDQNFRMMWVVDKNAGSDEDDKQ